MDIKELSLENNFSKKMISLGLQIDFFKIHFDIRFIKVNMLTHYAYVKALKKSNVIDTDSSRVIIRGLQSVFKKILNQKVDLVSSHTIYDNIKILLLQEIGDIAHSLYLGRSDQIQEVLVLHLYLREQILFLIQSILDLQHAIMNQSQRYINIRLPQLIQSEKILSSYFSYHLLACVNKLQRDIQRLLNSWSIINAMPFNEPVFMNDQLIDMDQYDIAELLHFDSIYLNSVDAVNDFDFVHDFIHHTLLTITHLQHFYMKLVLWENQNVISSINFNQIVSSDLWNDHGNKQENLFDWIDRLQSILKDYIKLIETLNVDCVKIQSVTNNFQNTIENKIAQQIIALKQQIKPTEEWIQKKKCLFEVMMSSPLTLE